MGDQKVSIFMGVFCVTVAKKLQLRHGKAISLPVMFAQGNQGHEKPFDCARELQWMTVMRSGIELQELKRSKPQQYCVVQFSAASLKQESNYEKHDSKDCQRG